MNIAFIGFGNMAKAIAQGLLNTDQHHLSASAPSLSEGYTMDIIRTHSDNAIAVQKADIVILAVKPQQMAEVLKDIIPVIHENCLLISVAAGLPLSWLGHRCHPKQPIIRSMPNTPAAVNEAATALIANTSASQQQKIWAEEIFSNIGMVKWIERETDLDILTALAGSGPAYVYKFMESLVSAAEELGLNHKDAYSFTCQTVKGALKLAEQTNLNIKELRKKVTSPMGTTAAALDILCNGEFDTLILNALKAAQQRSIELGKDL
ncbi:pyrroline-5-carboxylate reductase [Legionella israelensis]|uniref:pyrroline-5-carboxylate reductase n=1 Tax=Legionella israelensis TaxID=454 RepID=UPI00117DC8D7|nr:pyrroline-5-carboxylate reductase [Legionella israelensis]QDP72287.1 pyrroline-5-carboxylate reductase [Legionella israelensis]